MRRTPLLVITFLLMSLTKVLMAQSDSIVIDYMLCFDKKAQSWVSSHRTSLEDYADEIVNSINTVYSNSNVKARFRVADIITLDKSFSDPVSALNSVMIDSMICRKRWESHADLTVVLVEPDKSVTLGGTAPQECDAYSAFSAIRCSEAATGYIACHESGHNIGCQHGRLQDDAGTHAYAVGCERTPYYTVMVTGAATATQLAPVFSGPETVWKGVTMGSETENNVRMLRERLPVVSQFGDQVDYAVDWNEWNAGCESASRKLKIKSSVAYDIKTGAEWVKTDTDGGYGNSTITVTLDNNTTLYPRTATILIYDSWYMYAPQTVTISQDGQPTNITNEQALKSKSKVPYYVTPDIYILNGKKYEK